MNWFKDVNGVLNHRIFQQAFQSIKVHVRYDLLLRILRFIPQCHNTTKQLQGCTNKKEFLCALISNTQVWRLYLRHTLKGHVHHHL